MGLNNYSQMGVDHTTKESLTFFMPERSPDLSKKYNRVRSHAFSSKYAALQSLDGPECWPAPHPRARQRGRGVLSRQERVRQARARPGEGEVRCVISVLHCGAQESGDAKVATAVPVGGKAGSLVACGTAVSYAVVAGDCYSWGMGTNGQLGTGEEDDAWSPVLVR